MDIRKLRSLGLVALAPLMGTSAFAQIADLPPNAKPGECYARVLSPERYEASVEQVVIQPASERVEIIPAQYTWDEREVVVSESYERLEVIPAQFETRTETVIVEPERVEFRAIPAKYETRTERVKVREAYSTWKKGEGPISQIDSGTGEIMCLVEIPAEFRTVERQVLVTPARTERVTIPAKTSTVERQVIKKPSETRKVRVPAETQTVRYQKLVSEPKERKIPVAAITDTVTTQKLVSQAELQWAEILCETNVTEGTVREIQQGLTRAGFYEGAIDGRLGPETNAAIDAYQRRNRLSTGELTIETLDKLGISKHSTI